MAYEEVGDEASSFLNARRRYSKRIWSILRINALIALVSVIAIFAFPHLSSIPMFETSSPWITIELGADATFAILGVLMTAVISLQVVWRVSRVRAVGAIADQEQAFLVARSRFCGNIAQTIGASAAVVGLVSGILNAGGPDELKLFAFMAPIGVGSIVMLLAADVAAGIDENLERELQKAILDWQRQAHLLTLATELGAKPGSRQYGRWASQFLAAVLVPSVLVAALCIGVNPGIGSTLVVAVATVSASIACVAVGAHAFARFQNTIAAKFVSHFFLLFGVVMLIYLMLIVLPSLIPDNAPELVAWLALLGGFGAVALIVAVVTVFARAKEGQYPRIFDALALLSIWWDAGKPDWDEIDHAADKASSLSLDSESSQSSARFKLVPLGLQAVSAFFHLIGNRNRKGSGHDD